MAPRLAVATVGAAVYDTVKDLLLSGHFKPGERIRERELTELLGVSRTPIREALRMLEQDHLVDSVPRRGFRMRVPAAKELKDFYELRAELEGLSAALAAERASDETLAALHADLQQVQELLAQGDAREIIAGNNRFHDAVARAADNRILEQSLSQLRDGVNLYRTLSWSSYKERPAVTWRQHSAIYLGLAERNPALARERAVRHIWDSLPLALAALTAVGHPHGTKD